MNVEVRIILDQEGNKCIDADEFERLIKVLHMLRDFETKNGLTTMFDVHIEDFTL